jgi:hypothetical protein
MSYAEQYQDYRTWSLSNSFQPINFMQFCSLVRRGTLDQHKKTLLLTK